MDSGGCVGAWGVGFRNLRCVLGLGWLILGLGGLVLRLGGMAVRCGFWGSGVGQLGLVG